MSAILFILPGAPLAFNHSGAASRYAQNFLALHSLGHEIHVLRFHSDGRSCTILDFENASETAQKTRQCAASWQDVELPANGVRGRVDSLRRMLFDPVLTEFPHYHFLTKIIRARMTEINPSLLWAEHSDSAAALWGLRPTLPWVYSQTDMRYLIRSIRGSRAGFSQKMYDLVGRRAEAKVTSAASLVLTGSYREQVRLQESGSHAVCVIPMVNHTFPNLDLTISPAPDLRLVHLGALETTANRHGLTGYLARAHAAALAQANFSLMVVGDVTGLKPPLSDLLRQPGVVCAGYVPDLGTVLRPFDVSILPYTQDSGYRTKLPLLMGYAQVILATRAALAGSLVPGLDQACILVDRVEDFPAKIAWLAANPSERKRLGLAARAFAERCFSFETVRPLYADLISQVNVSAPGTQPQGG
jgi:glycosyltransferase involved in cell wall biosynthesis